MSEMEALSSQEGSKPKLQTLPAHGYIRHALAPPRKALRPYPKIRTWSLPTHNALRITIAINFKDFSANLNMKIRRRRNGAPQDLYD